VRGTVRAPLATIFGRYALLIDFMLLLVLWQIGSSAAEVAYFPSPVEVWNGLFAAWNNERDNLGEQFFTSTRRVVLSVGLGTTFALPLALLTAQSMWLDRFLSPLIYFLYPAPKVVFIPLIITVLGLGDESRVFLISLVIFFQVFVIVHDAAALVPMQTLETLSSLGADRWQMLRYVYIPISIPAVTTALKISTGTAIAVLFIAETIAGRSGLGFFINDQWNRYNYVGMYAGIVTISALGLGLFAVFTLLERWLTRWQRSLPIASS
jgi:ABC-type nitrate/sulfonate/bicarbonate transport system permease component